MLDSNGAIYYMNGNDGTDFDWDCNNRLCEFFIFHKNEIGFIQILVTSNDTMVAYVYPNGEMQPTEAYKRSLCPGDALFLKYIFLNQADYKNLFNKPISEINYKINYIEDIYILI